MQESGLTEIIPLIGTSAVWDQYPMFSHSEFHQDLPAPTGGMQSLMTVTSLFTDMAGNIPFLISKFLILYGYLHTLPFPSPNLLLIIIKPKKVTLPTLVRVFSCLSSRGVNSG